MRRPTIALLLTAASACGAAAQDGTCGAKGPAPKSGEIKLVSWNIAELASEVQVFTRPLRTRQQFDDLVAYRDCNAGDVYALQEIASLRALGRVFPPADYILCISGQVLADKKGLAPKYPRNQLGGIEPHCITDGSTAITDLPAEATTPARQYVALALRRASGISLQAAKDVVDLGPEDPNEQRQTRWGLDVTIGKGGKTLRMLVVHMKSRCPEGAIEQASGNPHCQALALQLAPLKSWIAAAQTGGGPVVVLGDFNRRFDREPAAASPTDMWDVITGASTASSADDVKLAHVPKNKEFECWPDGPDIMRFPIDFFVLNAEAQAIADADSYWKWRYAKDIAANTPDDLRPSDHCPIQLNVKLP
jgi:hypothetical protein